MKTNIHNVLSVRDKLVDKLSTYVGVVLIGDTFDSFVDDLCLRLPKDIKNKSVIQESVSCLINQELTKPVLFENMWRLAGNQNQLRNGKVCYPWKGQIAKEWMPVQTLSTSRTKTMKGEFAYKLKMRILSGSASPLVIYKICSTKMCSYLASKIGFSPSWKNFPYRDGSELTNMRFLIEIDPKLCRDQKPGFENFDCNDSLTKWNKTLLKARAHLEPPCPFSFTHFCYQCPVGYDKCTAGTHPKTFESKFCNMCNEDTWHDPEAFDACTVCRNN